MDTEAADTEAADTGLDVLDQDPFADDLAERGIAPPQLAGLARVGVHGRVGEGALQLRVLHEQRVDGGRGHWVPPPDTRTAPTAAVGAV